ncbi:MAG: serine/threonine-protein kinase [Thermoanaerobaculia bacterium]|nr:serine/threonine-protein kinase [Thermoanaerobaculia bacterium]
MVDTAGRGAGDDLSPEAAAARWQRIEELLDELLDESDPARREARLRAVRATEPELGEAVAAWLAAASPPEADLLDRPAADSLPDLLGKLVADGAEDLPPETIDRYRLREVLGRGGMGVVYLAERADDQFEKRVALKLLPSGLETPEKVQRFRAERQILARLEHPGIARLLDGGVTEAGLPYLVMERVEGEPIDRHCERNRLPLRARLELFLDVCAAVQFAHGNLVVHRDLKPANILVTPTGEAKLLDFGVAEILDREEGAAPAGHLLPLTPDYAAPEQLAGRAVSTASDVYSLGVVLFRILTGTTPARLGRDLATGSEGAPPAGPASPSRALAALRDRGDTSADAPGLSPASLRGDLDAIVGKALAAAPTDRYVSAAALADDLRRHLEGHPVLARPATRGYRIVKFVRRHRAGTAIAAAVAALLAAGAIAVGWQARIAHRERDRARLAASRAERVAQFIGGLFEAASPASAGAGRLSLRELLDESEARLRSELASEPAVRGQLLDVMASAYAAFGETNRALDLARAAVGDLRRARPEEAAALAGALTTLAGLRIGQGALDEAGPALREAERLLVEAGAGGSRAMARLERLRGQLRSRSGDEPGAAESHRAALALWRAHGAEAEAATEQVHLAGRLDALGRMEEGLVLKREALEVLRRTYGDAHPAVLTTRNNIAFTLHHWGRHAEAEEVYRAIYAEAEGVLGPAHPDLANSLSNLGKVLMDQGRFAEAAPFVRRAAAIRRRTADERSFGRLAAEVNLGSLELALGNVAGAVALYRNALAHFESLAGEGSLPVARCRSLLGVALHRAGDPRSAERLLRPAVERLRASGRPFDLADALAGLGAVLNDLGAPEEALANVEESLAIRRDRLPPGHGSLMELNLERGLAWAALGRTGEATAELAAGEAALATLPGSEWLQARIARLRAHATSSGEGAR